MRLVSVNSEINQSLDQLEVSISRLLTISHEARNCISIAINLVTIQIRLRASLSPEKKYRSGDESNSDFR
jgi:hypothetical protein